MIFIKTSSNFLSLSLLIVYGIISSICHVRLSNPKPREKKLGNKASLWFISEKDFFI